MRSIPKTVYLGLLLVLTACSASPSNQHADVTPDTLSTVDLSAPPASASEWVERYVLGAIGPNELCDGLAAFEASFALADVAQEPGVHIITGENIIDEDLAIAPSTTVVLLPGAKLRLGGGITMEVQGRVIALGKEAAPVVVTSTGTYKTIRLAGGFSAFHYSSFSRGADLVTAHETGDTPLIFEDCSFEHWQDVALRFEGADGLLIQSSSFGLESAGEPHGECINGKRSAVEIHGCTFGPMTDYADVMDLEDCQGADVPHIIGNTLLGGQDDGIDLDDCDALVAGNLIKDFWPPNPTNPYKGVNGGGITGHNSSPLLINNIVIGCFHGIGFKNGARPVLIHNTVIDGNIGVTLYRTNSDYDDPHGTLLNNIVVGNAAYDSGANQDLVLHGRWWPSYDPSPGDQASVELEHNLFGIDFGGATDRAGTITFEWSSQLPYPPAGSLADGSGHTLPVSVPGFGESAIEEHFARDFVGESRPSEAPALGALEVIP